ncbi:glycine oxidase ThiO [Litchfieldia alkalitelluris]|uniref:glycine oxidase ThiO n=1 Tax=Litchfieldia alkalitelluris TaxID=304268 RepID=UPI0009975E9F|nr:glycine oxidase ThiO [Litchfieldia alkalitelluris]
MSIVYDCIVIGGGVNGGSISYNLAKRGHKVLVLEKDQVVSKASSAAAGMLAAGAEFDQEGPLFQLARRSRAMFPVIAEELKELTQIDIEFINKGMYKIAFSQETEDEYRKIINFHQQVGEQVKWVTGNELINKEPNLSSEINGAMYLPNDGQVSAPNLSLAFIKAAAALGADIREFTEVYSLLREAGRIIGVKTSEGTFYSEKVIVANGAWSSNLLADDITKIDAYPVKGECFSVITHTPLISSTIFSHDCYLVPKRGGRIIVGATVKPDTFNQSVSMDGIRSLMEKATRILPSIGEARWEKAWAGIRPQTKDGLPYLGQHPDYEGLFIATGHYRNGILLAPITGHIVADLIEGKNNYDLSPFRLNRQTETQV